MGAKNPHELDVAKKLLTEEDSVLVAIVFGSFARGKEGPSSDLDLAIAGHEPFSPQKKVEILTRLSSATGREVDLVDLNEATGTVFKEAIGTGKILVKKDSGALARVLQRLFVEEADFMKLRSEIMAARRKKAFDVG